MSYVYANNDFQGGTLLNRSNFENLFPFAYFDLTKQKLDIKDRWSYKTGVSLRAIWSDCNKLQYLRLSTSRARGRNRTAKWKTTASCLRAPTILISPSPEGVLILISGE